MQQLLFRLPERKAERLPNLKEILYECEEICVTGMEAPCQSVGVKLVQKLKYGRWKNQRRDSLASEEPDDMLVMAYEDFEEYMSYSECGDYVDYVDDYADRQDYEQRMIELHEEDDPARDEELTQGPKRYRGF